MRFFAKDRIGHRLVKLGKDQPVHAIVLNKSGSRIRSVLPITASKSAVTPTYSVPLRWLARM